MLKVYLVLLGELRRWLYLGHLALERGPGEGCIQLEGSLWHTNKSRYRDIGILAVVIANIEKMTAITAIS